MLEKITVGAYTIDFSMRAISKDQVPLALPKKISGISPWRFLELLVRANGRVLTYNVLDESDIWEDDGGKGVDHKHSLRTWVAEFNKVFDGLDLIRNAYKIGYSFNTRLLTSSFTRIPYFEALWKDHYRGIVRDQRATGNIRELIDFYALPDICAANGKRLRAPFADLSTPVYVTAGSGLGKTTLLHMALLVSIAEPLAAAQSKAVSENSTAKLADYQAIRQGLFADTSAQDFPVFIRAAEANTSSYASVLDLADARNVPHFKELVDRAHDTGTLLLLIDSIDEVEIGDKANTFLKDVHTLLREYPKAKAIITSRFMGKKQLPFEHKTTHIQELSDKAIQKIVTGMLSHRNASSLLQPLEDIKQNAYLCTLAQNPFMLLTMVELKNEGYLYQILESIINAIFERRWDTAGYGMEVEDIKLLLGHLACRFIFGNLQDASFIEVRDSFLKAQQVLQQYGCEIDISAEKMDRFLHTLSCQSGILNLKYTAHVEKYLFQDPLVMCWLAAYYVSRILTSPDNDQIVYRGGESSLWSNAAWLNTFLHTFTRKQCHLSADAVNTLVMALVLCGDLGGRELQQSILYYMLFQNVTSANAAEKANLLTGYKNLLSNTFGPTDITNQAGDACYQMISAAIASR